MRQYFQVFEEVIKFQMALNSAQLVFPDDIQ